MLEMRLYFGARRWKTKGYITSLRGGCGVSCLLRVNGFRVVSRVSWAAGRGWSALDSLSIAEDGDCVKPSVLAFVGRSLTRYYSIDEDAVCYVMVWEKEQW